MWGLNWPNLNLPPGSVDREKQKKLLKSTVAAIYKDLYSLFIFFLNLQNLFSII